jgi:hypothetical protein
LSDIYELSTWSSEQDASPSYQSCSTYNTGTIESGTLAVSAGSEDSSSRSNYDISFDGGSTWVYTGEQISSSYDIPSGTSLDQIMVQFYWYSGGGPGSATVTIDVWYSAPEPAAIQTFTCSPVIQFGQSGWLYAEFTGSGTSAIIGTVPGGSNISSQVSSGSMQTVWPNTTTTYYLTVTDSLGNSVSSQVTILVTLSMCKKTAAMMSLH